MKLLQRTLRGILEHLYLSLVGAGVIATALLLMGTFALVVQNIDGMISGWSHDAHLSAYFRIDTPAEVQISAQQSISGRAEVMTVSRVSEADADAWMRDQMPDMAPVLDDLGENALPASLEITLRPEQLDPDAVERFAKSLIDSGAFESIDYGKEWVGRLDTFLSLLRALGLVLGILTATGTLFLVTNTVHLAIYARKDELAIMRLVGATDTYIVAPFALEGGLQGFIGGLSAVGLLFVLFESLERRVGNLLPVALGNDGLHFLPLPFLTGLILLGFLAGASVNTLATLRFLRQLS